MGIETRVFRDPEGRICAAILDNGSPEQLEARTQEVLLNLGRTLGESVRVEPVDMTAPFETWDALTEVWINHHPVVFDRQAA